MVVWIVGMSGAGKTTLGRELYRLWKRSDPATILVDGDEIRRIFHHDRTPADYSLEGRRQNADRITELCAWLDRHGINVVCCILSVFEESRRWNRRNYSGYFEVYLEVPFEVLVERDQKELYEPALRGEKENVVGVDLEWTPPESPDMTIDNSPDQTDLRAMAEEVLERAGVKI